MAGPVRCAAIQSANTTAGADIIDFNIAGSGVRTIALNGALPQITEQVTIDGTTQPGFATTPIIQLNGNSVLGCERPGHRNRSERLDHSRPGD